MATKWQKTRVDAENLNNGNQYEAKDRLTREQFNAIVNNSFYSVDFVEAVTDTPDTSEINNEGTPSVTFVDNIKNGQTFKKFKFSNLRGEKGEKGEKGDAGVTFHYDASTKKLTITTTE